MHRNRYVKMTQTGIHQCTMYHNIPLLLNILQRLYSSHILMLHLSNLR